MGDLEIIKCMIAFMIFELGLVIGLIWTMVAR